MAYKICVFIKFEKEGAKWFGGTVVIPDYKATEKYIKEKGYQMIDSATRTIKKEQRRLKKEKINGK